MDQTKEEKNIEVQVEPSATTASSFAENVAKVTSPVKNSDFQEQEPLEAQTPSPVKTEGMNLNVEKKNNSANAA